MWCAARRYTGATTISTIYYDLAFSCERTLPILFADLFNSSLRGKNANYMYVQQLINDELKAIVIWLEANKLSPNTNKQKQYTTGCHN